MNIATDFRWKPFASMNGDSYAFPAPVGSKSYSQWNGPAAYRWVVFQTDPGDLRCLYIGETANLTRRVNFYLHPGPTQQTNVRIKKLLQEQCAEGRRATLEVLEFDHIAIDEIGITMADFKHKYVRCLLENLFILYFLRAGYDVLNRLEQAKGVSGDAG